MIVTLALPATFLVFSPACFFAIMYLSTDIILEGS